MTTQSTDELVKQLREVAGGHRRLRSYAADTIERLQRELAARDKTIEALREDAVRFAVLPYITKEIADEFGGVTYLLVADPKQNSGYDWTQDAVDFACLIASAARSEGEKP